MGATKQFNVRLPHGDREALFRAQRELSEREGRQVTQVAALVWLLREGLRALERGR